MNNGIYGILSNKIHIDEQLKYLENAYSEMPSALNCIGCGKCCQVQHPNCYYIEFVNILNHINEKWEDEQKSLLHYKCVENYLSNSLEKQCVFLNEDMSCGVYDARDYNCRAFGIIPKKTYEDRVKKKKKEFKGKTLSLQKQTDCCPDIKPFAPITAEKLDDIFEKIYDLDAAIGVPLDDLKNSDNYLTFHDHYMLHTYSENIEILQALTAMKDSSKEHKESFLNHLKTTLGIDDG